MSTKDKLIERFKSLPKDFTFDELVRLMAFFGFDLANSGATSGSRVSFVKGKEELKLHRPHPGSIMKRGVLVAVFRYLHDKKLV